MEIGTMSKTGELKIKRVVLISKPSNNKTKVGEKKELPTPAAAFKIPEKIIAWRAENNVLMQLKTKPKHKAPVAA